MYYNGGYLNKQIFTYHYFVGTYHFWFDVTKTFPFVLS